MKVYTEGKNMQLELIRLGLSDFIEFTIFEVGIFFSDRCAHCIRYESPLFGSEAPGAPDASGTSVRNVVQAPIRLSNSLLLTSFITV